MPEGEQTLFDEEMSSKMNTEPVIAVLDNEIAHLSAVYATYKRLYHGDNETRILLSDSDSAFFNDLYLVYLSYISIAVSRLLDPERTGKKANLTIFTLIAILNTIGYTEARTLNQRLKDIKARAYNFIDPRNQLVSHMDYAANCINPTKKAIPSFVCSEFEQFYKDIGILMNDIRAILGMPPNMYEWGMMGHGCGRKLIHRLRTAYDQITDKTSNNSLSPAGISPTTSIAK